LTETFLFRQVIHKYCSLLTVAIVLVCPLLCMGSLAQGDDSARPKCCCSHCQQLPTEEPAAPAESGTKGSSCLCCGATLSESPAVSQSSLDLPYIVPIELPAGSLAAGLYVDVNEGNPLDCPSGRMLRLEHCALRC
jgi:hypothetical protein